MPRQQGRTYSGRNLLWGGRINDIGDESVAATRNRLDETAIRSQRLAQRRNLELKIMLLDHRPRPDATQKLVLSDEFTCCPRQSDENIESPTADRYGHPIREELTTVHIESKAAKSNHVRAPNGLSGRYALKFLGNLRFFVAILDVKGRLPRRLRHIPAGLLENRSG
jgi:hypothetical protein